VTLALMKLILGTPALVTRAVATLKLATLKLATLKLATPNLATLHSPSHSVTHTDVQEMS
jgi:hypothetical protein